MNVMVNTMVSSHTIDNKPIKCTLTRIENEFNNIETYVQHYDVSILKNYVYNPQKRLIA